MDALFDRITDYGFNHKAHKDHRGLAKVNTVPDSPKNLLYGLCVLCELCGLYRRRSVWSDYRLRILTTKRTKITEGSQRLNKFLITRKTFRAGFVPFVSFVVYTRRRSVWSDYRLRILTTKCTKITKESQRLMQFLITRETFRAGFVPLLWKTSNKG